MSGNKYELVNAAYTPEDKGATRGGLFFKIIFKQDDANLSTKDLTDSIVKNYLTGTGAGWGSTTKLDARDEIIHLVEASNKALTDAGAKYVVESIMAARNIREDATSDKATKDRMSRILELYQRVYNVTQTNATGASLPVNVTNKTVGSVTLDAGKTKLGPSVSGGASDDGKVGVMPAKTDDTPAQRTLRGFGNLTPHGGINLSAVSGITNAGKGITPSTWNEDKFYASYLNSSSSTSGADAYSALIGSVSGPKYTETVNRNAEGKLIMKTKTGDVEIETWAKTRQVCDNVVVGKDAGKADCASHLMDCLKENKDGKPIILQSHTCMVRVKNTANDAGVNAKDSVKDMDPRAAFRFLKNCGFKGKKVDGLVRVEPWDEWVKRVKENKLTEDDKTAVTLDDAATTFGGKTNFAYVKEWVGDAKVQDFIKLVIGYIDSNKAILNKSASSGASKSDINDPFGRKRPRGNDKNSDLSDARVVVEGSLHHMHAHMLRLFSGLGGLGPISSGSALLGLVGGGNQVGGAAPAYVVQPHSGRKIVVPRFSERLQEIYDHYLGRLKGMNKDLSESTKDKVKAVLDEVKSKEDNLLKWVEYLQRYYEVAQIEGDMNEETVGPDELKQAYEKYEKNLVKLRKRSINFIDILSTLSTATNDAETGTTTNLTM